MYRHIIKSESKDKKLNEMLDRLDEYFYEILGLIPLNSVLDSDPEDMIKGINYLNKTKQLTNDFTDLIVEEHEKLNMIDTKLDGLESMLKDIQEKLDK